MRQGVTHLSCLPVEAFPDCQQQIVIGRDRAANSSGDQLRQKAELRPLRALTSKRSILSDEEKLMRDDGRDLFLVVERIQPAGLAFDTLEDPLHSLRRTGR